MARRRQSALTRTAVSGSCFVRVTGLDAADRQELLDVLSAAIARGGEFVRRRAEVVDAGFVKMWTEMGGAARFDRRRHWWAEQRDGFSTALH
jgi:hypothetical protein